MTFHNLLPLDPFGNAQDKRQIQRLGGGRQPKVARNPP